MRSNRDYTAPPSGAVESLRKDAAAVKPAPVEDDHYFAMTYMMEKGDRASALLTKRVKPAAGLKDKKLARLRQEAEDAAATVLRHRIEDNEKRYPEIFAQVRSPDFLTWYETATGQQWDRRYEAEINEMRYRVILATTADEKRILKS